MKALTISQPYAAMIAHGEKWVENRTWATGYRGPLAIHAGKRSRYLDSQELASYTTGAVIAICELVACVHLPAARNHDGLGCDQLRVNGIDVQDFLNHLHTEGPWCWVLKNVEYKPLAIPATGKQGLWEWDAEARDQMDREKNHG